MATMARTLAPTSQMFSTTYHRHAQLVSPAVVPVVQDTRQRKAGKCQKAFLSSELLQSRRGPCNSVHARSTTSRKVLSPSAVLAESSPSSLEVVETQEPNSRVRLSVTVPPKLCGETHRGVIKEFAKQAKIPGFRPGTKIPDNILINFIGKEQVKASSVEAILKRTLPDALANVAERGLKDSEHVTTKFDSLVSAFDPAQPLSYEVVVDIAPSVVWKSERVYASLAVEVALPAAPAEAAADAELVGLHRNLGALRVVVDRPLERGDVAVVDIAARQLDDGGVEGQQILSANQKGFQLDTEEEKLLVPGFVDALAGAERGVPRTFDLTFPEWWHQEKLRNKQGRFVVEVKELFYRTLPPLDDELAAQLMPGCASLAEVKERLLAKHCALYDSIKTQATHAALVEALGEACDVEIPFSLMEEQGRQMYSAQLLEMQANGKLTRDQIAQLSDPQMVRTFLVAQRENIETMVRRTLAVSEVFRVEALVVPEEEVQVEAASAREEFEKFKQEYDDERLREQALELLEAGKVLRWLESTATITYVAATPNRA